MKCPKCDNWIWTNEDARKKPKLKCPLCGALVKHPYLSGGHEPIEKEGFEKHNEEQVRKIRDGY